MKKINVLEIIGSLHVGGAEKSLLIFLKNIDRHKFAPVIVTMFWNENYNFFYPEYARLGIPIYHLRLNSWRDLKTFLELRKIIRRHHIHIAHSHVGALEFFGSLYSYLNGVRLCLYTKHNHRIKTGLAYSLQRILLNRIIIRKVLSISHFVTRHLVDKEFTPFRKIELVYNPVELPKYSTDRSRNQYRREFHLPEEKYLIGNTSRFDDFKGFDIFYQMGRFLVDQKQNIHLVVTASGDSASRHHKLIKYYGLEQSTSVLPFQQELTKLYQSLDCFLFASRHTEGFGMVLIEAMAFALPIVGLNIGVISELVTHDQTGLLPFPQPWQEEYRGDSVPAAQALSEAVAKLITNPDYAHRLGENARKFVARFDALKFTRDIERIYTQLYQLRYRT